MQSTLTLVTCTVLLASLPAAEPYTQKPEIAPSVLRDTTPNDAPVKPDDTVDLFQGIATANWIWGANDNTNYTLSKTFTNDGIKKARIRMSCDNNVTLYLNGKSVASSGEWQEPAEVDITKYLVPGENRLEAEVRNEGGVAGFVLQLATDRKNVTVVTDKSWTAKAKRGEAKGQPVKVIGKYGRQPWGNIFDREAAPASRIPANTFVTVPGFQVEKLFTVPKNELGSWVNITADDRGRLIVSDQGGLGLCRVTPAKIGSGEETKVERIPAKVSGAQGLLWHKGVLYVVCNGGPGSGLYRVSSSKNDDILDKVEKLKALQGGGEHGPHAVRLAPDGNSLYVICGNHTQPPEGFQHSRLPRNWSEDHLLPRQWDANGHARGVLAPGGYVAKTDFDGKTWEIFTSGYRNAYDFAFNSSGEMFVYDADMEWDMGMPWYRPTRVNHATSGSELGWRSGTGKWPSYYPDSLPAAVDIGPGSPVGVDFGYGAKFPAKYQKALFICDWTFGTMYAIHTEPYQSTYKATKEEFLSRTPLPLTDVCINPVDGAMYFTIGGRGTQSELYRVTYVGKEPTTKFVPKADDEVGARTIRHKLESFHIRQDDPKPAVEFALPALAHSDRYIRYAARIALEHQPVSAWQDRVLMESNPEAIIGGVIALARQGDKSLQPKLIAKLGELPFNKLGVTLKLEALRAWQLVFIRMGEPAKELAAKLVSTFDGSFPDADDNVNRELAQLLVYLKSPTIVVKVCDELKKPSKPLTTEGLNELILRNRGYGGTVGNIIKNAADQQKLSYFFTLRNATIGWTLDRWKIYYAFLAEARTKAGGSSYQKFLANIEADAYQNVGDSDRLAIEAAKLRPAYKAPELPKPTGPGKAWTVADLVALEPKLKSGRNFKNGQKAFAATRCVVCHRFANDGGATGPDLTQLAGRFSLKDLAEAMVEPSKVISDQYKASVVETLAGTTVSGRIVSESGGKLVIVTDPEDSTKVVEVAKADVDAIKPSTTSLMPDKLINVLNENEVLDLLAYLLSRGDPNDPVFKKR